MNKEVFDSEESKYDDYFTMNNLSVKLKEVHSRITDTDKITHQRQSDINLLTKIPENKRIMLLAQRKLNPLVGMITIIHFLVTLVVMIIARTL